MDDLISRQAAIDALAKNMPSWTTPDGSGQFDHDIQVTDEAYVDCMQIIHDMPSAQPEQRWIPCSERMPKVGQDILMSVGGMYTAEGCLREDGDWAQFRWDTIQRKDMVGAWMPLPEPYKERRTDEGVHRTRNNH